MVGLSMPLPNLPLVRRQGTRLREAGWLTGGVWRALGRLLVSAACSDGRSNLCGVTAAEVTTARLGDAPVIEALVSG
jgi:hypothetical protein